MAAAKKGRGRRLVGDVVRIDLGDGTHTYAQILHEPLVAFFDIIRTDQEAALDEIIAHKVLFKIWVMNRAVTSGRWPVVGHAEVPSELAKRQWFCKQDPIDLRKLVRHSDGEELPATFEECEKLERAAVWSAEHVEDRLRDHWAGRPNKWVESLKIKKPPQ